MTSLESTLKVVWGKNEVLSTNYGAGMRHH